MYNLTKLSLQSPSVGLYEKLRIFFQLEMYGADNIQDFNTNLKKIQLPIFKKYRLPPQLCYVVIYDVGIERIFNKDKSSSHTVRLHDSSGTMISWWTNDEKIPWRNPYTFEDAQEDQGLLENDNLYRVGLLCQIKSGISSITDVKKKKINRPRKKTLLDRINEALPAPELQPSY